jgi:ribosomal protein S14
MSKKKKKIFKKALTLAPKITFNHKVTVWRRPESKHLYAQVAQTYHTLLLNSLQDPTTDSLVADRLQELRWGQDQRSAISRPRSYCYYVGRARGTNQSLFMGRHVLRKFARFGMLPGFIKERC